VGAPAVYRALAGSLVSPAVRVLVRPLVHVAKAGDAVRAKTDPARVGATAVLQTYDREHFAWQPVARSKLDGRSSVRFALPDGLERVRVLVVGSKGWADGVSRSVPLVRAS
jgi:hypothetical protein